MIVLVFFHPSAVIGNGEESNVNQGSTESLDAIPNARCTLRRDITHRLERHSTVLRWRFSISKPCYTANAETARTWFRESIVYSIQKLQKRKTDRKGPFLSA
jgi:hypothetical protein